VRLLGGGHWSYGLEQDWDWLLAARNDTCLVVGRTAKEEVPWPASGR